MEVERGGVEGGGEEEFLETFNYIRLISNKLHRTVMKTSWYYNMFVNVLL